VQTKLAAAAIIIILIMKLQHYHVSTAQLHPLPWSSGWPNLVPTI
jgi:hypothetical protein